MNDKVEVPCEEVPCEAAVAAVVSLDNLLDRVIRLKLKAIRKNDKELFDIADGLEHYLKLLMDKNTIFERW